MSNLSGDELKELARRQAVGGPQPGEVFLHYRGGLYVIVARSIQEDTLEPLVTYRNTINGTNWTRTLASFTEAVSGFGPPGVARVPRFARFHREGDSP